MLKRLGNTCTHHLQRASSTGLNGSRSISLSLSTPIRQVARCSKDPAKSDLQLGHASTDNAGPPSLRPASVQGEETGTPTHKPLSLLSLTATLFARPWSKKTLRALIHDIQNSSTLAPHLLDAKNVRHLAESLAHTNQPYRARKVIVLAHQLGCRLRPNVYEGVVFHLAKAKRWALIPSVVSLAQKHTGKSTLRLLNWHTLALVETGRYAALRAILDEFEKKNVHPDKRTFHLLLSAHLRNQDLPHAQAILQKMQAAGFLLDPSTHAVIVSAYRSLGPDANVQVQAFAALRHIGQDAAVAILNGLLRLYLDAQDLPGAMRVLSMFGQPMMDPDPPDGHGASSIPPGGAPSTSSQRTKLQTLAPDHRGNTTPNAATFNLLMRYMIQQNDPQRALHVLSRMCADGIEPDSSTAVALVHAFFAAGDPHSAIRLVASMCDARQVPPWHFESLAVTKAGLDKTPSYPSLSTKVPVTVDALNALLHHLLSTHGSRAAIAILRLMKLCKIKPDDRTMRILMVYLESVERLSPRELIRILRSLSSTTSRTAFSHLHVIFKSLIRREKYLLYGSGWKVIAAKLSPWRHDASESPMNRMAKSVRPSDSMGTKSLSRRSLVRSVVQSLSSRGVRSDRATYGLRIRHEAVIRADLRAARDIYQNMLASGMHPNGHHFSALMEGHAQAGDLEGAQNVMDAAVRAGIKVNAVMFTILIVGYARQGDPDSAYRTFREMVNVGVKPDPPSIDAVASAYFFVGAHRKARQMFIDLWHFVQPSFPPHLQGASLRQLAHEMRAFKSRSTDHRRLYQDQPKRFRRRRLKRLLQAWDSASRLPWERKKGSKGGFRCKRLLQQRGNEMKMRLVLLAKSQKSG